MKFFIDTASLAQIKEANELGILDGVTTNPSLMAKEGVKGQEAVFNHYKTICEMVNGDVSAEVTTVTFNEMIEEGKKLRAIHPNIIVKIPMIKDGVKAIKKFSSEGIRTNCTLVFSAGQALLAAKAGASYVSMGCVFPTSTKSDTVPVEIDELIRAKERLKIPLCVIGGISQENVDVLARARPDMVAMCSGVWQKTNDAI